LVKVKMSAVPVHTAIVLTISPSWAISCIDIRRCAFLLKGTESVAGGQCLVAWPKVCRPPELGGLGVPNLQIMGYALRMRWLWERKTQTARPYMDASSGRGQTTGCNVVSLFYHHAGRRWKKDLVLGRSVDTWSVRGRACSLPGSSCPQTYTEPAHDF
jgi:hypothetical protein